MLFSLTRNVSIFAKRSTKVNLNHPINNEIYGLHFMKVKNSFATKKKKVIELNPQRVNIQPLGNQVEQERTASQMRQYLQIRKKIDSLPWESMEFDKLCSLQKQVIEGLEIELKKDKFNITDQQFLANQLKSGQQLPLKTYENLDNHYKKIYTLLKNTNHYYDQFPSSENPAKGYLHEIYVTDLINDKELNLIISRFINYVSKPQRLEGIAEPTFVKYLLAAKRELLLQGINFETKSQLKQLKDKKEQVIESANKEHMPKIKILQILNYEYEFWQDVKHNRAKNGSQQNFIIQTRQVPNPNQSLVLRQLYPTVKIKYIARHKSLRDKERCFCIKADLLIEIDEKFKRKIKVEWKGPSSKKMNENKTPNKKSSANQENQEHFEKVNYLVIDYEDMYEGNPTVRPIFYF